MLAQRQYHGTPTTTRRGKQMRIAAYNLLKGGTQRVHWVKLIEEYKVDLLLVQESYPHDEHLPPHSYPDARTQSVWEVVEQNAGGVPSSPEPDL